MIVWDRGSYEQGGRVAWPEALERGHAVFVLHGEKLVRRVRPAEDRHRRTRPQWLLIKRRDEHARPGSDIVAEQPRSVLSGRTLEEVLGRGPAPLALMAGSRRTHAERVWGLALTRGRWGISAPSRIASGTLVVSHSASGPSPARSSSPSIVGGRSS